MVSPRTPLHKTRYGPSGVGGNLGGVGGGGGSDVIRRKKVPGLGLGLDEVVGVGASSFEFQQNNNGYSDLLSDDELVNRAREAFARAERTGASTVDLEEREWEAWQRHEAIEREVERRVQERLRQEEEKRRKVTVPAPSRVSTRGSMPSSSSSPAPAPGFLIPGDGFAAIGGGGSPSARPRQATSPRTSVSQAMQSLPARSVNSLTDFAGQEQLSNRGVTPPMSPPSPSLSGSFPEEDPPAYTPSPQPYSQPTSPPPSVVSSPAIPSSSISSSPVLARRGLASRTPSPTKRPLPPLPARDNLAPQPGSSYYPGVHPSLASRSESDVSSTLDTSNDNISGGEGSVVGGTSIPPTRRVRKGVGAFSRQL